MERKVILGIDPGLANLGYGAISVMPRTEKLRADIQVITYGTITTCSGAPIIMRLSKIYKELEMLINSVNPTDIAIERFIGGSTVHNRSTTCTVNQAIGAILSCVGNYKNIPVHFFSAKEVKKNITGYGSASKLDIQNKVKELLLLSELPRPDHAADALAFTITYSRKNRWI